MEYRVSWLIDVEADSPQEAAEFAQSVQRDKTTASTFTIINEHGDEIDITLDSEYL